MIIDVTLPTVANLLIVPSVIASVSNPEKLAAESWIWPDEETTLLPPKFSIVCADEETVPDGVLPPPPPPPILDANDDESVKYVDTANLPSTSVCDAKLSPDKSTVLENALPTPVNVKVEPANDTFDT